MYKPCHALHVVLIDSTVLCGYGSKPLKFSHLVQVHTTCLLQSVTNTVRVSCHSLTDTRV